MSNFVDENAVDMYTDLFGTVRKLNSIRDSAFVDGNKRTPDFQLIEFDLFEGKTKKKTFRLF